MEKLFARLINRGTDPVGPIKTVRNVRFLNTILLVAITNVFIYIIKNLLLARYDAAFFESVTLGLLFFAFWLNKKNHIAAYALTFVLMEAFFLLISLYLFPRHGV